jgi:DNA-binding IclR family transcriptional regulator
VSGANIGETSQALDRGVRTLTLLADTPAGFTVTELAAALGSSRPAVYRVLATLGEHGLIHRAADGRVRLGLGVLRLARGVQPLLRDAALPVLRDLAEEVGATAHLTVADGDEALAVAVVEPSWTSVHVAYRVGSRHPLERGAAGRAILAARRPAAADRYVLTEGELQPGAQGIAAPVPVGLVEASVGVVSLAPLDAAVVGPRVVLAAAALAAALTSAT